MKQSLSLPSIFPVTCHTDYVGAGSAFVAIQGFSQDGADYIPLALSKGATTIVVAQTACLSDEVTAAIAAAGAELQRVTDPRLALAQLSAQAAGNPAQHLKLIAITGTKGKTTTAWLVYEMLRSAQHKTALMSGVYNKINAREFDAPLTTSQPDYLHQFLKLCYEQKVTHVVMEIAAQAFSLHRVAGLQFDAIAFTNFAHEHLEFYKDLEDYFSAKCEIIKYAKPNAPFIINKDNNWTARCLALYNTSVTYSCHQSADVQLTMREDSQGLQFDVLYNKRRLVFYAPALMGEYNLYNCAAALTIAFSLGIDTLQCAHALEVFEGVPGRLETYTLANDARVIIDYAHTPDSYQAVLSTLRNQTNDLTVIFGAGGKRDKSKRPIMGSIAASYADRIILTSDNPRDEDPRVIVKDIQGGIDEKESHKVTIELDRKKAIVDACQMSKRGSIIALLGKGNDEYQIIGDKKYYFSEREIVEELM